MLARRPGGRARACGSSAGPASGRCTCPSRARWSGSNADPDRIGFGYGTLPGHLFRGEEAFTVERDDAGDLWFVVTAFSVPDRWWVRLGGPAHRGRPAAVPAGARARRPPDGRPSGSSGPCRERPRPGRDRGAVPAVPRRARGRQRASRSVVAARRGAGAGRLGPDGLPRVPPVRRCWWRSSRSRWSGSRPGCSRRTCWPACAASGSTSWCSRWSARSCRSRCARGGACSASPAGPGSSPPPRGPSEPAARGGGPGARTPVGSAGRTRRERRCHGEGLGA